LKIAEISNPATESCCSRDHPHCDHTIQYTTPHKPYIIKYIPYPNETEEVLKVTK
jgi:hypothetical protein